MIDYALAGPNDVKEIEESVVLNFGEEIRKLGQDYLKCSFSNDYSKPFFVVAKTKGKIVGVAAFSEELFTIEVWGISWVSVHTDYRNQGIGGGLVDFCNKEIERRITTRSTVILNTMPGKYKLYEKCGYRILGEDHSGGFFMTKTIEPKNAK